MVVVEVEVLVVVLAVALVVVVREGVGDWKGETDGEWEPCTWPWACGIQVIRAKFLDILVQIPLPLLGETCG